LNHVSPFLKSLFDFLWFSGELSNSLNLNTVLHIVFLVCFLYGFISCPAHTLVQPCHLTSFSLKACFYLAPVCIRFLSSKYSSVLLGAGDSCLLF
jgi:hypothetical protein